MRKKYLIPTAWLAIALIAPTFAYAASCSSSHDNTPISVKIADNGTVLLRNIEKDGKKALPLSSQEKKNKTIHMFGFGSCDIGWLFQGNGGGRGTDSARVYLSSALKQEGFTINEKLLNDYNNLQISNRFDLTEDAKTNYTLQETTTDFVQREIDQIQDKDNGIALFVVSRNSVEGNDIPKFQGKKIDNGDGQPPVESIDTSRIYSELSSEEEGSLNAICNAGFSKVIVLLNTCSVMECGFLENDKIDAALYMPMAGNSGTLAIPHILDGRINPSGHLVDTMAYDLKTAPSYYNMSWENDFTEQNRDNPRRFYDFGDVPEKGRYGVNDDIPRFTAYEENIYIGYYWYETADAEGYWQSKDTTYDKVVQFPFGYGQSYTTFAWDWVEGYPRLTKGTLGNMAKDEEVIFKVKVTNTGSAAGRDVVQLYVTKPYTKGGIEKPAVQLVGYAKTKNIKPGQSDMVTIKTRIADFADYDCYDKNNDGNFGYELDKGCYHFTLRTDAHTVARNEHGPLEFKPSILLNGNDVCYQYTKDMDTGYDVKNRFTNFTNTTSGAVSTNSDKYRVGARCGSMDGSDVGNHGPEEAKQPGIGATYMTRAGFVSPTKLLPRFWLDDDKAKTYEDTELPPLDDYEGEAPVIGQPGTLTIEDVKGLPYEDPKWDELMKQLSWDEIIEMICQKEELGADTGGGGHIPACPSINKPTIWEQDGPCGFSGSHSGKGTPINFPNCTMVACTWDIELAKQLGEALGDNAQELGWNSNYGPGANIHRSPLGGRNYEYYSEDPFLSGTMASWHVSGAKSKGLTCYVKHIAMNESDTIRNGRYVFATEQAFRQIYAKPFEIVTKGAVGYDSNGNEIHALKGNAFMASIDRVGTTRITGSYAFLTEVVRNEWGFRGTIISDWYQSGHVTDIRESIRSGNNLMCNYGNNADKDWLNKVGDDPDSYSPTTKYYLYQSAKGILYTYIDTKYCNEKY